MKNHPSWSDRAGGQTRPEPASVSAIVLTHRRPRLATEVVRSLVEREGLPPERVVVVVNGTGGLDDATLEASVRLVRLPRNLGPASGFGAGMEVAFADPSVRWAYLCEDDVGLLSLPSPRLADVLDRAEARGRLFSPPVGSVVAFGRRFVGRGSHTVNVVPLPGSPHELVPVDVASWGATLLSRAVFDAGILPDPEWFFGLEDFDFYCRVREGGFEVLLDAVSARAVADEQTLPGEPEPFGCTDRSTNTKRGGRTTTPATPSCWPDVTAARRGTCGTWPTRPGDSRGPPDETSAERFSMASGTVLGGVSVRIRTMAGRWASTPKRLRIPALRQVDLRFGSLAPARVTMARP